MDEETTRNRQAAEALIDRVIETADAEGLDIRTAAAYEIGRTRGVDLDRLEKVVKLARRKRIAQRVYPGQLTLEG